MRAQRSPEQILVPSKVVVNSTDWNWPHRLFFGRVADRPVAILAPLARNTVGGAPTIGTATGGTASASVTLSAPTRRLAARP